ncbi:MAG TPA: ATP-grasp domain-containing protein [Acidimicrobiia bacterium]|jgi:biotin carboxylase
MSRVLLLVPTSTYRAPDFVAAARRLGIELVVGADDAPVVGTHDRVVAIPLEDVPAALDRIEALDRRRGVDAVVAVDDGGVVVAAEAGARLGFPHSPPDAVAATRDKAEMRRRLAAAEVPQPRFGTTGEEVGFPCVVKPTGLSGSQGVIRCDSPEELEAARARIRAFWSGPLLVEEYVPGAEVALEGLLRDGVLEVLAVFDKPDALEGPYFEETIYVTPSRLPAGTLALVTNAAERAARAIGLTEGPVHAEVRIHDDAFGRVQAWVIEVAARSIGGLCARTLRFGAGISLEEVILRHALGMSLDGLAREPSAAGVMMLPIEEGGTLAAVRGRDEALAVDGIVGLEITVPVGRVLTPLPEGDRYLGFLFARAATPAAVEAALREAASHIDMVVT